MNKLPINRHIIKVTFAIIILAIILPSIFSQVNAQTYSTQQNVIDKTYDISLFWSQSLGSKDWTTYKLWDDGISTHCYISFKFNTGLSLSIPASLRLKYSGLVEPGQQFNLETYLNIADNKEVTLSSEFFVKIDLDLPGVTTYVPGVGWIDDIKNVYGASYDYTFNLNTNTMERLLKCIWLGNDNTLEKFSDSIKINDFVTIQNLNINSQTLGNLIMGSIKINVLKAILTVAKDISNIAPPISLIINALDWLITNVIKVDSGLIITPSLNGQMYAPIASDYQLNINQQSITYSQDISPKQTICQVSTSAKESRNNNNLYLDFGPLNYEISFNNNWEYYIDLDIDFLGLKLYQNNWSWNLGDFPNLSTEVSAITPQINCNIKLDEPMQALTPLVNNGEISITANDASGVSNIALFYSTDRTNWASMNMDNRGDSFKARPINSVQQATTVYYYLEATDGDNDQYRIDNNAQFYTYNLEPDIQTNGLQVIGGFSIGIIIVLLIVILMVIMAFFFLRKKDKKANK